MRGFLTSLALLSTLAACARDDPPAPDAGFEPRCCDNGSGTKTIRMLCLPGEVGLPVSRCEPVDAGPPDAGGPMCGDGVLTTPMETCDPSAAQGDTCVPPTTCVDCQCVSRCGNGTVDPEESCELNAQCNAMEFCRKCFCRLRSSAVDFPDPRGDVAANTAPQVDIVRASITAENPPAANIEMIMGDFISPQAQPYRLCVVLLEGMSEVQRLCFLRNTDATFDVLFTDNLGERSVRADVTAMMANNLILNVPASFGLRLESAINFYFITFYGNNEADRLPDQGVFSMSEVIGR